MEGLPSAQALPRIAITFCTQCRWLLRAAYYAQELISTFGTSIGEVALLPSTGGVFTVELTCLITPDDPTVTNNHDMRQILLWDRKADGGFPETKILKQRVRDHIVPEKSLGHSDTPANSTKSSAVVKSEQECQTCSNEGEDSIDSTSK